MGSKYEIGLARWSYRTVSELHACIWGENFKGSARPCVRGRDEGEGLEDINSHFEVSPGGD